MQIVIDLFENNRLTIEEQYNTIENLLPLKFRYKIYIVFYFKIIPYLLKHSICVI